MELCEYLQSMSYNSNSLTSLLPPEVCPPPPQKKKICPSFYLSGVPQLALKGEIRVVLQISRKPPVAEDWSKNGNYNS